MKTVVLILALGLGLPAVAEAQAVASAAPARTPPGPPPPLGPVQPLTPAPVVPAIPVADEVPAAAAEAPTPAPPPVAAAAAEETLAGALGETSETKPHIEGVYMSATKPAERAVTIVSADNFIRAESDLYFGNVVKDGGFGRFHHIREPAPIDQQNVIRLNRDTLYSAAVFDLAAGPVTITLPEAGDRFMSMQVFDEDEYTLKVVYGAGSHTLKQEDAGTRYVMAGIRTLVDPANAKDVKLVHTLQDAITVEQKAAGYFETPNWDQASQRRVRESLLALGAALPDSKGMFGAKGQVDPVRRLVGAAMAWGGNPETEAMYLNVTPAKNDGKTVYRLSVKDVPVDGFWSVSLYNAKGYFEANPQNAYSLNNLTAKKDADGSMSVQFGGCDGNAANCLPIMPGWNYIVRLYRPRAEILSGKWVFPSAQPVQ